MGYHQIITSVQNQSSYLPNKIQVNDAANIVTDPNQIVNIFDQHFCNIGDTLAANVPKELRK